LPEQLTAFGGGFASIKKRDSENKDSTEMLQREQLTRGKEAYRIYSNKRCGAYSIFPATSAALIRGRRLLKHCTRQIYFFPYFYSTLQFLSANFPLD